jgi:hypothetical protein
VTVALFVEAVDTIRTLGWALIVWIVLMAAVTVLAAYTVIAAVAWPCGAARDALGAALAASRAVRALPEPQTAPDIPQARPAPSWARTDKEAA